MLRWWAGDPALEEPVRDEAYRNPIWVWIDRLPRDHEKRRLANEWRTRYARMERDVLGEREFQPRAARVAIAIPPGQQRFIRELADLIEKIGLKDEPWLLLGAFCSRVERYLAGKSIPIDDACWELAERLSSLEHVRLRKSLVQPTP
ncbi:hypothetical protein JK364_46680 [Streptomyces sp. 110]|uniref:Uncharacterized protein n=1 Tax=Streptomyces endocoffeicus TaxID=2898945 RepID=A0ABS1Q505_9ACTN|nr:hypothetical protein [Streptomyces endocoffeicus]MBL1119747.1 hypothetical protein [Streptomyces endocoffeicus]